MHYYWLHYLSLPISLPLYKTHSFQLVRGLFGWLSLSDLWICNCPTELVVQFGSICKFVAYRFIVYVNFSSFNFSISQGPSSVYSSMSRMRNATRFARICAASTLNTLCKCWRSAKATNKPLIKFSWIPTLHYGGHQLLSSQLRGRDNECEVDDCDRHFKYISCCRGWGCKN